LDRGKKERGGEKKRSAALRYLTGHNEGKKKKAHREKSTAIIHQTPLPKGGKGEKKGIRPNISVNPLR